MIGTFNDSGFLLANTLTIGDGVTPIFSANTANLQASSLLALPSNTPGSFNFHTNSIEASGTITSFKALPTSTTPEPGRLALFGSGLAGLLAYWRRGLRRPSLPCRLA